MISLRHVLLLITLGCLWGPSFLFIKIIVVEIPPITTVAIRVSAAALILYAMLKIKKIQFPKQKNLWWHFSVMAFLASAFPFFLYAWGQQYIDSAMAAVINGSSPLITVFLAHYFLENDRLSWDKVIGVLTGILGVVALIGPSALEGFSFNTWGLLAAFLASTCYGIAFVYSRKYLIGLPKLVAPTAQFIMSAVMMIPAAFLFESPLELETISNGVIFSFIALVIFGTALAQVLYFYLVEKTSATFVSLVTYIIPIVGLLLGVLVANEIISWTSYLGTLLIFLGIMIVNRLAMKQLFAKTGKQ